MSEAPGKTSYGKTLFALSPKTWREAFCPDGQFHEYKPTKYLRKRKCTVCGHVRGTAPDE